MPKYFYRCKRKECLHAFTTYHSMKELLSYCPKCDEEDALIRVPRLGYILYKTQEEKIARRKEREEARHPAGSVVNEHIDENREILREEKRRLKKDIDPVALYEDVEVYEP